MQHKGVDGRLKHRGVDGLVATQQQRLMEEVGSVEMLVFEETEDGTVSHFPTPRLLTDAHHGAVIGIDAGDGTDGLELHHVGHLNGNALLTQDAHQADGLDGVATQFVETVECAHGSRHAEYLLHGSGNDALGVALRLDVFGGTGDDGCGQRTTVHLAARSHRHLVERHIDVGNHVFGQCLGHEVAQKVFFDGDTVGHGVVEHQVLGTADSLHLGSHGKDALILRGSVLYLAQLDAETA